MYCGHARLCVCLSVCLSVRGRMPTLLHGPGCNLGNWQGMPPSYALMGGFAIGERVSLLWQHNANPSYYKLASTPRHDDIVRTRNLSECSVLALWLVYSVITLLFEIISCFCCGYTRLASWSQRRLAATNWWVISTGRDLRGDGPRWTLGQRGVQIIKENVH